MKDDSLTFTFCVSKKHHIGSQVLISFTLLSRFDAGLMAWKSISCGSKTFHSCGHEKQLLISSVCSKVCVSSARQAKLNLIFFSFLVLAWYT